MKVPFVLGLLVLCLSLLVQCDTASASIAPRIRDGTHPIWIGNMTQSNVNRDSCGSTLFGTDSVTGHPRLLWTCRDTMKYNATSLKSSFPLVVNTAGWSLVNSTHDPMQMSMEQYGTDIHARPFYDYEPKSCPNVSCSTAGNGNYGTGRFVLWPNQPPAVTSSYENGTVRGYMFIQNDQIAGNFAHLGPPSNVSLYRLDYSPSMGPTALPAVQAISYHWFDTAKVAGYGDHTIFVHASQVYLYGHVLNEYGNQSVGVGVARVSVDHVEDLSAYWYFVNSVWTQTQPLATTPGQAIPNYGREGQGTLYYSEVHGLFIWLGCSVYPGAQFRIQTSPAPEGPWSKAWDLFTAPDGTTDFGAYSCQAHPGMSAKNGSDIFVSYTKLDPPGYSTPVFYLQWNGTFAAPTSSSSSSGTSSGSGSTAPASSSSSTGGTMSSTSTNTPASSSSTSVTSSTAATDTSSSSAPIQGSSTAGDGTADSTGNVSPNYTLSLGHIIVTVVANIVAFLIL